MNINQLSEKVYNKLNNKKEYFLKITKQYSKPFIILALIFLLAIYPIIRANFNYIDDIGRVAYGYQGWDNFSRYLSCFISNFIHTDSYLTDISPLPQIISIIILAISSIIILKIISEKQKFSILETISIIPLGISPYFLECMSFKYDSPYMAISIFASCLPFIFLKKGYSKYLISIILSMLIMCMTYQASSGIFPMLVILISLNYWIKGKDNKKTLKFISTSIIGYIIGLLIFKLFLMNPISTYASNALPELNKLIPTVFKNLKMYFDYITNDFKIEWLLMIELICLGYTYIMARKSKKNFLMSIILSLSSLILMFFLSFGMYSLLELPLYSPRAMYGFGIFISLIGCSIMFEKNFLSIKLIYLSLCWCFFVFSFTYGNALYQQKEYTNFRTTSVLDDLKDIDIMNDNINTIIQINGNIGFAPPIKNMPKDYNILYRLVPIAFRASSSKFGRMEFSSYYNLKNISWDSSIDLNTYNLPIIKDTMYHTIKGNKKYLLIILK